MLHPIHDCCREKWDTPETYMLYSDDDVTVTITVAPVPLIIVLY